MSIIKREKKYNYFYKITNLLNGHYYYGIHSTDNMNDGYMGSGSRIKRAIKKYGIENFEKEVLKFFDTREELAEYEADVVTEELVHDNNCYNVSCGGDVTKTIGTVSVIDKDGNKFRCDINDPKYISGEYLPVTVGKVAVYNKETEEYEQVSSEEYKEHKEKYETVFKPKYVTVSYANTIDGSVFKIPYSEYKENREKYKSSFKDKIVVKDRYGNLFKVSINDKRYLSGELKPMFYGKHHTKETKDKLKKKFSEINHQKGEFNSQYGTCWVTKDLKPIKIKKECIESYIQQGYKLGRQTKPENEYANKIMISVVCPICGSTFMYRKHNLYGNPNPCCSKKCQQIKNKISKEQRDKNIEK